MHISTVCMLLDQIFNIYMVSKSQKVHKKSDKNRILSRKFPTDGEREMNVLKEMSDFTQTFASKCPPPKKKENCS